MLGKQCWLALAVLVVATEALYSGNEPVVQLTASDFQSKVVDSNDLWLVEFYAPWCGHCKSLAPEWTKAAKALKGIVKMGAVDMDKHQSVGAPYQIQGFPTIKVFGKNKKSPQDFQGGRTAQAIVDEAMSQLKKIVSERMGGGGSKQSGSSGSGKKDVVELTDANFESMVLKSDDIWLVEFFAPWCGHCKSLEPEWARAATDLKGKVRLGAVDATVHASIAQKYDVKGYPTIKYFAPGAKASPTDFDGGRTANDIVQWSLNKFAEFAPAPEVVELTSQKKLEAACESKQLCLIAFLPSLFECQSKCRTKHIKLLKKMAEKYKRNQWAYLWTEPGKHAELEKSLQVGGFGFPAFVAVNSRKGVYVHLKGSFGEDGLVEFLRDLSFGRGSPQKLPGKEGKLPVLSDVAKWDGKDLQMEKEEEIDLSDVKLDDDVGGFGFRRAGGEL